MLRKPSRQATRALVGVLAALLLIPGCTRPIREQIVQKPPDSLRASPEDLRWFQQARFGLFIHWGPVSLKGTEIGWSRGGPRPGRTGTGTVPVEEYDNLYKRFNPTAFNAREWVALARDAGMKYVVFTTKHHDGFCMFDSRLTDYKITNTPFRRDVTAELAEACHEAGLKLGFYYSPPDWYHPDYRSENHARYVEYMHGQLRELCTRYGKVDILWFDGLDSTAEELDSEKLFAMIRSLQPGILINNRAGLPGDFDTPEQTIGQFQNHRPWESCITIGRQWSYKPDDKVKSREEIIQTLVQCAGGDGNLLLNVGPMPTGQIEPAQAARLREVGAWLKQYGHTIYGTRGGPFVGWPWGASTYKGNEVFLHVFNWPQEIIKLPAGAGRVVSAVTLTGDKIETSTTPRGTELRLPSERRDPADTILALKFDRDPATITPIERKSLTTGKKATASNVYQNNAKLGAEKALDGNRSTRWATDTGVLSAWLEVDLGEPATFNSATLAEEYDRVREFELQIKEGEVWRTITKGTKIGPALSLQFEPVTARYVRLNILKATNGPTIWEFQLHRDE